MLINANLNRAILEKVEREGDGSHAIDLDDLGPEPWVIGYHLGHLRDQGLIVGVELIEEDEAGAFSYYEPTDLTDAGRSHLKRVRAPKA